MYYALLALFYLAGLKLWLRVNKSLFDDRLSPLNLLLFSWVGPLALRTFNLSELERTWSWDFTIIICWVTLCLIVTSVSAVAMMKRRSKSVKYDLWLQTKPVFEKTLALFRNKTFLVLLGLLFVVSFCAYIYNEFITNPIGIPLLTYLNDPTISRDPFHRWGKTNRSFAGYLSLPIYPLVPMLYLVFRLSRRRLAQIGWLICAVAYPIMTILKLSRIDFLNALFTIVLAEYYYRRYSFSSQPAGPRHTPNRSHRKLVFVTAAILFLLAVSPLARIRGGGTDQAALGRLMGIRLDTTIPLYPAITEAYVYFAMPFENFSNFYQSSKSGFNPGIGFFRPVLSIIGYGWLADEMLDRIDMNFELLPLNTYPFVTLIYFELGIPGVLICPIVYGLLVSFVYTRFRQRPNFVNVFVYLMCPFGWLWLFSAAGFTVLALYLEIAFVVAFYTVYRLVTGAASAA